MRVRVGVGSAVRDGTGSKSWITDYENKNEQENGDEQGFVIVTIISEAVLVHVIACSFC